MRGIAPAQVPNAQDFQSVTASAACSLRQARSYFTNEK